MSVTQPADTDRTPSHLSKDLTDKKPKNGKSTFSLTHEFDPTGLVQRCVIIQRDENGFGLTVSGDNPVFVQLVKEDGAAMRAGVQTGDRIIKVNGTLVTHSNHLEVVELIKSGSYVALTVLGRPPGLPQMPLEETKEEEEELGEAGTPLSLPASISPALGEQSSFLSGNQSCSPNNHITCTLSDGEGVLGSRICDDDEQEDVPLLKDQTSPLSGEDEPLANNLNAAHSTPIPERSEKRRSLRQSQDFSRRDDLNLCSSPDTDYVPDSNLKVPVPESVSAELEKRRLELIPEELCKQYTQALQDSLRSDLHKNLEDFRQKRSMGLTLAEDELSRLDIDGGKDLPALEKECACAEHILARIEDILPTTQYSEEEKCFCISRGNKPEKDSDEKPKKPRFPNILVPRLSRVDSTSLKNVEMNKQRSPKFPQPAFVIPEPPDHPVLNPGRSRTNQLSQGSDTSTQSILSVSSLGPSSLDSTGQETDSSVSPVCVQPRLSDGVPSGEHQEGLSSPTSIHFDFSPSNLDHREEDQDVLSHLDNQSELFYTERAHLRTLRVLDCVFCQRLNRDGILPPDDIKHIFINLEEIIQLHVSITEQMTAIRKRSETSVIGQIGDDLLAWFSEEEEKIKRAVGTFCSNQPSALELIKTRQKKDQRFNLFMQEAESNRLCRRLQLKDIIPVEMQRVTKYPLLLDNIAKYSEECEEREKVKKAAECCKKILNHVNQAVKEAENKQRLVEYQRRLDVSSLKQSENPVILELRNLDLTKREMVHEGPLTWKVNKDKTIELYTLLLKDIMVLLQKQDERLVLKFHGKNMSSVQDAKHSFSPVIKLSTVLVRPVATENKAFFVLSMSENGVQMYELRAQTVSDRRTWQCLITQCADAMKAKPHHSNRPPAQSEVEQVAVEIMNQEIPKQSCEPEETLSEDIHPSDKDALCSPDIQTSTNPFDCVKSEDEEEELADAVRQEEEEEEVDEAELEAFLDGQLADRLLQEGSRHGIAVEDMDLTFPSSKAEEALRTLVMLKETLYSHLMGREPEEEDTEDNKSSGAPESQPGTPEVPSPAHEIRPPESSENDDLQPPSDLTGESESAGPNTGFVGLDFEAGFGESSTEDDVGIDMRKLLSSSSQAGGDGPDLSRQLMTHLRLLQADLQYLKDVEMKYNELKRIHNNGATDSDDNNEGLL
ncbi:PREDICTED: rho guanine nucleotide exchange factor 12-like [Cyprinodon variegatus]|uniref:rho guanine nucleotide exchange factor 12-like n=1 Tax=Cyprinodon variegatus TaxID=28743 RepID=UPI0007427B26|nr:PREDICTED: rho guanine nucleotide exchange factor 12-like [Cyprinodon variegatus]